jgi:ABC-type branched-subunit amino acid transport system ATPase component
MSLVLDDLQKSFGGLLAVRGASFEAVKGQILGMVGPNGAGKTTLFNLITGVLQPTAGRVLLDGKDITGTRPHRAARLGIGRTFQQTRIFHHLKVYENVMLARREIDDRVFAAMLVTRADRAAWRKEAVAHLETVGIGHLAEEYGSDLSYAEQKLVMFACLIAGGARVLLLDEPTAGIDPSSQQTMIDAVRKLRAPDRVIVLIEHNLDVVRGCCERVVFLAEGKVLASGAPAEVEADPALRDLYFGSGVAA